MLVNPMTALAFLDFARKNKAKAVVLTAAASALGKMTTVLMERCGIKILHVVRSQAGVEELQKISRQHIMNSTDPDFVTEFRAWCLEHNARLIFDAVGGELVNQLLDEMPSGATIILYGNLSKQKVEFMPPQLIRENKKLIGFFLGHYVQEQGMLKTLINLRKVNRMLKGGMASRVQGVFALNEVQKAIETYEENMGKGKVLLRPHAWE